MAYDGWVSTKERKSGKACVICGFDNCFSLQKHHLVPVCEGGSDDENNMVYLCCNCHRIIHSDKVILKSFQLLDNNSRSFEWSSIINTDLFNVDEKYDLARNRFFTNLFSLLNTNVELNKHVTIKSKLEYPEIYKVEQKDEIKQKNGKRSYDKSHSRGIFKQKPGRKPRKLSESEVKIE